LGGHRRRTVYHIFSRTFHILCVVCVRGEARASAGLTEPNSVARFLAALGEPTDILARSPSRDRRMHAPFRVHVRSNRWMRSLGRDAQGPRRPFSSVPRASLGGGEAAGAGFVGRRETTRQHDPNLAHRSLEIVLARPLAHERPRYPGSRTNRRTSARAIHCETDRRFPIRAKRRSWPTCSTTRPSTDRTGRCTSARRRTAPRSGSRSSRAKET
jgi:hypothetical protein